MTRDRVERRPTVALAADQTLVGQAVGAALTERGVGVLPFTWGSNPPRPRSPAQRSQEQAEVGLLLYGGGVSAALIPVLDVLERHPMSWLVVAGDGPDPLWGALLEAGATAVLPSDASVDDVDDVLRLLADGGVVLEPQERQALVDRWRAVPEERREVLRRVRSLSPRELAVLGQLVEGRSARSIAARSAVAETTVRSQVKAVLHKLGVGSRLGAVAAVRRLEGRDH